MTLLRVAAGCWKVLTSLIFPKIYLLLQIQLISIHLSIEAIIFFQYACQASRARVDSTPVRNGLRSVDFRGDVLEMTLAKFLDWDALPPC